MMTNESHASLPILERKWMSARLFTGKQIKYRNFTIGQQKTLLLVKETNNKDLDTYRAVVSMVQECVEGVNVEDLHPSEFEELFYNIRATSDSKILKLNSVCQKKTGKKIPNSNGELVEETCGNENEIEFNLMDDFKVNNPKNFKSKIEIVEEPGMILNFRQPRLKDLMKLENKEYPTEEAKAIDILNYCVESVVNKDQIYNEFTYEDANKFLNSLPDSYLKVMMDFFKLQPAYILKQDKVVKCEKCGGEYKFTNSELKGFL